MQPMFDPVSEKEAQRWHETCKEMSGGAGGTGGDRHPHAGLTTEEGGREGRRAEESWKDRATG